MDKEKISVIKIRDILLVTAPSDPDDGTIAVLQERTLEALKKHEAKGLVLDISTVDTMDSFFARTVAETAEMIRLLGGRTVIAGMRPSVAITVTQLGMTLGKTESALDVERAFELLDKEIEQDGHDD